MIQTQMEFGNKFYNYKLGTSNARDLNVNDFTKFIKLLEVLEIFKV